MRLHRPTKAPATALQHGHAHIAMGLAARGLTTAADGPEGVHHHLGTQTNIGMKGVTPIMTICENGWSCHEVATATGTSGNIDHPPRKLSIGEATPGI